MYDYWCIRLAKLTAPFPHLESSTNSLPNKSAADKSKEGFDIGKFFMQKYKYKHFPVIHLLLVLNRHETIFIVPLFAHISTKEK